MVGERLRRKPDEILGDSKVLEELTSIAARLDTLMQVLTGVGLKEKIDFYFSYPEDGVRKTIGKGTTMIDFYTGLVRLPDGKEEQLTDNLKLHDKVFARSFIIEVDTNCTFNLDGQPRYPLDADDYHAETVQNFQKIYLHTTENTEFSVWACSNPNAFIKKAKSSAIQSGTERRIKVSSVSSTHFTASLAQNEGEDEDLTGLLFNKITIKSIIIRSVQQLDFNLHFWSKDSKANSDPDDDAFLGYVNVDLPNYGYQIGGTGLFYLDITDVNLDYVDADNTNELHITLQNLSSTAKNAGTTGAVAIEIYYVPRI